VNFLSAIDENFRLLGEAHMNWFSIGIFAGLRWNLWKSV
jgi:hypothetical protein